MKLFIRWWLIFGVLALPPGLAAQEAVFDEMQRTLNAITTTQAPHADREALAALFYRTPVVEMPFSDDWQVGDVATFYIADEDENRLIAVEAELMAIGEAIYVWVEAGMPVHPESANRFASAFDTQVYMPVTMLWRVTPLGRLYTLFTIQLPDNIAGYFLNKDTLRAVVRQPDLLAFNLLASTVRLDNAYVLSITGHEFQHLLRYQTQPTTESWLDEGFSMFTEEYLDMDATKVFVEAFMKKPETPLTAWHEHSDKFPHYGASTLFLNYFYQRYGTEGIQALSAVSGGNYDAIDRLLREKFAADFVSFFADWALANRIQRADTGYGYSGVVQDADLTPAASTGITVLPYTQTRTLPQFAAAYYEIVPDTNNLTLTLDFASQVALLPEKSYSGNAFWYSRLGDNVHAALTCALDLSAVQSATLIYDVWYDLENFWDYGYVFVSDDDGQTWSPLITEYGTNDNPFARAYGWGYTGASQNWQNERVSLDAYAGREILVQFAVITDDATLQPGMALDNMGIPEIDYENTGDTDHSHCTAAGWARVTNQLPQRVIVQAVQHVGDEIHVSRWQTENSATWTLGVLPGAEHITLVITPVTPYTTMPLRYTLRIE